MPLTDYAIKALGFETIPDGEILSAVFYLANVYQIKGMNLNHSALEQRIGSVGGVEYKISAGSSVNEICQKLFFDKFVDDEIAWREKGKHNPPYLVILLGPTQVVSGENPRIKKDGDEIYSYDAFQSAKIQLGEWKEIVLPRLETALACRFALSDLEIRFEKTDNTIFGVTPDKKIIHDIRMDTSATLSVQRFFEASQVDQYLYDVTQMADSLDDRAAQFYYLALSERDDLKRFLFFFLSLEFATNGIYKPLRNDGKLVEPHTIPEKLSDAANALFARAPDNNMKSLQDHFVWSTLYGWSHIGDEEVREFVRLKKIRDDIAHGNIEMPNHADVIAVEKFVTNLLLPKTWQAAVVSSAGT
jgi:hypothetical protein